MAIKLPKSLLWISESTVEALLKFYDYPHPKKTGEIIEGYDKGHALRTAKMCAAVARHLGHDKKVVCDYQVACLLHDLGRAGLDEKLFGKIWSWANAHEIPTRPLEWRENIRKQNMETKLKHSGICTVHNFRRLELKILIGQKSK